MKTLVKIVLFMMALMPLQAVAHPGHGHENPLSPGHYVNNPEHSVPITLAIAAVTVLCIWALHRRKSSSR